MNNHTEIEHHPWEPHLPENSKVLFLGSFPPPRKRWSMDFYYPNRTNDYWKIAGLIFYNNADHFILPDKKGFNLPLILEFTKERGIALYDAGIAVRRLKENASDQFLEIVEAADLATLLQKIPRCSTVAVTGEKAANTILAPLNIEPPKIGESVTATISGREVTIWRMPSTSRAYPLPLEKKADYYRTLFIAAGVKNG